MIAHPFSCSFLSFLSLPLMFAVSVSPASGDESNDAVSRIRAYEGIIGMKALHPEECHSGT